MASQHPPIQIVDDNDRPIRGATLSEAYANGLIHRVVFTLVEDPSGNILLQKRGPEVVRYPDCWDISSAGHVDEGEDYLEAAERELEEELGISGFQLEQVAAFREDEQFEGRPLKRFKRIYRTVIPADTPLTPNPAEVTAVRWLSLDETRRLIREHSDQVANGLTLSLEKVFPE